MKVLQITNSDGTKVVNYLTDLIGSNESFQIFQVQQIISGVPQTPNVLTEAVIQDGFFRNLKPHNIAEFKQFVRRKAYSLYSYENLSTGSVKTTIWDSGYGSAGAIGEDAL